MRARAEYTRIHPMRCPNCGQENADASAFCFECGTRLKPEADTPDNAQPPPSSPSTTTGSPAPAPPSESPPVSTGEPAVSPAPPAPGPETSSSPPEVLRAGFPRSADTALTHLGEFFGLGSGPEHYAVWDLRKAGEPVAQFDPTPIGWEAAWRRFHDLERAHTIPAWRRPTIGWILAHVYIGLIVLGFVQSFLLGFILALAGREVDEFTSPTSWGLALVALSGVGAWLLFVFLRHSPAARWAVFLGLLGAGFVAALILGLAALP
jgi:hypothetical protein